MPQPCASFPTCRRCDSPACDHAESNVHAIPGVCLGYIGFSDCTVCGRTSWQHDEAEPHAITHLEPTCAGWQGTKFEGQGGGFGGGGASGGW